MQKADFVRRIENMGKIMCPVWAWPENIPSELCSPDWLHAVDQGIGADIAGQILVLFAPCYEARSFREQMLNKENIKKGAVATLKGPAAVIGHLISLLQILTGTNFAHGTQHLQCVHKLANFCQGIQLHGKQ